MQSTARLVVLISGQGSNLQAIIDACKSNELQAEIVAVISNKSDAMGLQRAEKYSIPAVTKVKLSSQTRENYDQELADIVTAYQPDLVVLAGWMRVLSTNFLKHFPNRVINLHPALPGAFPGINSIEQAFAAFQRGEIQQTGVMVHQVPDEGVDCGPVLAQTIVPIEPTDTLSTLTERVHLAEHKLLLATLKNLLTHQA